MNVTLERNITFRDWNVYDKITWPRLRKGKSVFAVNSDNEQARMHDPFAVASKRKSKGKLIAEIVGRVPGEILSEVCFFMNHCGSLTGAILSIANCITWF